MACRRVEVNRLEGWEGQQPGTRIVTISSPGRVEARELKRRFGGVLPRQCWCFRLLGFSLVVS
jgi:hypothetical protein